MAGGKLSPRQKMIGMMYLVLTALLALNVSKEIINAFVVINNGLEKTTANMDAKNALTYAAFQNSMQNDAAKTTPFYNSAKSAKLLADGMYNYIDKLKAELTSRVQAVDIKTADTFQLRFVDMLDNYDIPTYYLIGDDPGNIKIEAEKGKAMELKNKIEEFKKKMLALLGPKDKATFKIGMSTEDVYSMDNEKMVSWEWYTFYHSPIAAVMANLSKIQADVRNAEGEMVNLLYKNVSAMDFKFDTLAAKVIAPTSYVLVGEEYKADLFVAAFSSTQDPEIWLGELDTVKNTIKGPIDSTTVKVSRGVGAYILQPKAEGLQQYSGIIRVKSPDNTYKSYPFRSEYMVARPAVVVSPDKMNVFYIGVDNPVSISVPGIPAENISPSISVSGGSGSLSGSRGKYIVRVRGGKEANISVAAKTKTGNKSMGPPVKFRVKTVPDPVAVVAGKKGDEQITKGELKTIPGVIARLENFDFDLKFVVISFDMSMSIKGSFVTETSQSNQITPTMRNYLNSASVGSKVYFENCRAKGPDGTTRKIPGVNLKVK